MPDALSTPETLRDRFISEIAPDSAFHLLFDHMPGVTFFAKDRQSRLMAANRHFYERFGIACEADLIGKSDHDLFPARLAEHFRRDDMEVMQSGKPKLNIVELFFNRQGIPDWFITHKIPIRARNGSVIGVMGTSQSYEGAKQNIRPYLAIDRAVTLIRERYRERLTVEQLAEHVHLSPRQLQRKFVEAFGSSPQAFILRVRVQAACELLRQSDLSMSEIAGRAGFADHSSFTQHFRKHIGATPLQYQREFRLVRK